MQAASQPVQWRVDGGEIRPVSSTQQQPSVRISDGLVAVRPSETVAKQSALSIVVSHLGTKKNLPSSTSEKQKQSRPVSTSTEMASTKSLQAEMSPQAFTEGAALWTSVCGGLKPVLQVNSQDSPSKQTDQKVEPSTSQKRDDTSNPKAATLTVGNLDTPWPSSELLKAVSSLAALGVKTTSWDGKTRAGAPKTNCPEKGNGQDSQPPMVVSSSLVGVQSQTAAQKMPISIQCDPHQVGQALGTPVWGFQGTPVCPQTLLTGQLTPGRGQELQQQPIVTSAQIIINPTPFFSPPLASLPSLALSGSHSLHPIPVGALTRSPHPNIFFTQQAVMSERPHMPQTLPLSQLSVNAEPLVSGVPFLSERLLQCVICGSSFSKELDLQMHYLQHTQAKT